MKIRHGKVFRVAASAALFFFYWYFWGGRYGQFFRAAQDSGLFLFDCAYLSARVAKPGGFVLYVASFLGQFFYVPALGGLIFAALMELMRRLALALFTPRDARAGIGAFIAACVPPAIVSIAATWRGYSVFTPFEPAAPFAPTVGILVAFGFAAVWRRFVVFAPNRYRERGLAFVAAVAILYPLAGFWGLLGAALALVCERFAPLEKGSSVAGSTSAPQQNPPSGKVAHGRVDRSKRAGSRAPRKNPDAPKPPRAVRNPKTLIVELEALAILVVPILQFWLAFYRRVSSSAIFWTGALEPCLDLKDVQTQLAAGCAVAALGGFSICAVFVASLTPKKNESGRSAKDRSRRIHALCAFALLIPVVVLLAAYGDRNFFALCACSHALVNEDWSGVLEREASAPRPTGALVGARNVALFRLGALGERAFERPVDGARVTPPTGGDEPAALTDAITLSFGLANSATRVATYYLVQTDDLSARFIRTLAISALANEEYELARRYAAILQRTLFYRELAREIMTAANEPAGDSRLAVESRAIRALRPQKDRFVTSYPFFPFLQDVCVDDWETAERPALEIMLTNLLIQRRVDEFSTRLVAALDSGRFDDAQPLPKSFQEAWLLSSDRRDPASAEWDKLVSPDVNRRFQEFDAWRQGVDFNSHEGLRALFERFGDSFWGYYFDPTTSYAQNSRRGVTR